MLNGGGVDVSNFFLKNSKTVVPSENFSLNIRGICVKFRTFAPDFS